MLQILKNNKYIDIFPARMESDRGSLLVELIVVVGIIVAALGAVLGFVAFSFVNSGTMQQTAEAVALAEEGLEALRNYRDGTEWSSTTSGYEGLGGLAFPGPYYLAIERSTDPPRWKIVAGEEPIREFTRKIKFETLERDANYNIVPSGTPGGTPDPDSIQATITVSWQERGRPHEIQVVEYLTNWQRL
jgi:type II secretory pathway pseudopilin PulG